MSSPTTEISEGDPMRIIIDASLKSAGGRSLSCDEVARHVYAALTGLYTGFPRAKFLPTVSVRVERVGNDVEIEGVWFDKP